MNQRRLTRNSTYITRTGIKLEGSKRQLIVIRRKRTFMRKKWKMKKTPNLSLIKPGDMLLTINTRSTLAGLRSRLVAKFGKSPYAHVATYLGKENNIRTIRDFEIFRGGKTSPMHKLTTKGVNYRVVRWVGKDGAQLEKQIEAFLHNVKATTGRYDTAQLLLYSIYQGVKSEGAKKVIEKYLKKMLDFQSRYTCSEVLSEGGDPYQKDITAGRRKAVVPPLKFDPNIDKEFVTPKVINEAVEAGLLRHITDCEWEYN